MKIDKLSKELWTKCDFRQNQRSDSQSFFESGINEVLFVILIMLERFE
jgi:hypothetical protein